MTPIATMKAAGSGIRRATGDGGFSRVIVWFFVVMMTIGTIDLVAVELVDYVLYVGLSLLFLVWEVFTDRLRQWGALIGLLLFCAGLALNWHLPLSLGLAIIVLALPFRWAAPITLAALGVLLWFWSHSMSGDFVLRGLLALIQNVLLVYLLERVWRNGRALRETREELARTEVDAERTRLAGELNDVIGSTLGQVSLQIAEIRSRDDVTDPVFHQHMTAVADLVGTGLQQLELLSFEPVLGDLDSELHTAQSLCRRLGVDVTASVEDIDDQASDVFALMLRESVTNMFKHATPTRCTVAIRTDDREAIFGFTNDGVRTSAPNPTHGSGQHRWRETITALGGTLEAAHLAGGRYQVLARIPTAHHEQSSPSTIERVNHG